jgi:hypothetical protein
MRSPEDKKAAGQDRRILSRRGLSPLPGRHACDEQGARIEKAKPGSAALS